MPVQKVKIVTTVLIEADTPEEAQARLSGMSLSRIDDEMDQGDVLGSTEVGLGETVPQERLKEECEALGSDLSFFGDPDEDVEA